MRIRTLFLAATGCIWMFGCAGMPRYPSPFLKKTDCLTEACSITVTVTEDGTGACTAVVDIPALDLRKGPAGGRNIIWTISDGYRFSSEPYKFAIFINSDPRGQFRNAKVEANGRRLSIQFAHERTGNHYEYSLSFQRSDGSFCVTLDPWMFD